MLNVRQYHKVFLQYTTVVHLYQRLLPRIGLFCLLSQPHKQRQDYLSPGQMAVKRLKAVQHYEILGERQNNH